MTRTLSRRLVPALLALLLAGGCGPKVAPPVSATPPITAYDQKMRWILQLEDERHLRGSGGDLLTLLQDPEARVRRRAALATGRVRLSEAVPALTGVLQNDADHEVRQMAAFAMGLIGDASAAEALMAALADSDPLIQGRAAEALGLIAHKPAAAPIGAMMAAHAGNGVLNAITADDMVSPKSPPVEAVRLGAYALVRLGGYDALASSLLDRDGRPRSRWWPVAFAFQRMNDPRAVPVLLALLQGEGQLTRSFAVRGLAVSKDPRGFTPLLAIAESAGEPLAARIQAVRGVAAHGDPRGAPALIRIVTAGKTEPNLRLESVTALGLLKSSAAVDVLIDLASDSWPAMRAAALTALARTDVDTFVSAMSSLTPDDHWSVRAALATAVADLGRERAEAPLTAMLRDADQRVIPAVLDGLAKVAATNAAAEMMARLKADDPVVRAAAARGLATLKAAGATAALAEAVSLSARDGLYAARAAALDALMAVDPVAARPVLTAALTDKDWAVRLRAAEHLKKLDPAADISRMRPAPAPTVPELAAVDTFVAPPYSPFAYIDTAKGTIQFELAVLDAPRTVANFIALVRKGYFRGVQMHRVVPDFVVQDGDPRGDGEGGPGYTIRDEINQRPYLRGTVGMALDWADTGGSQFFITHSPQPHLDARYTVFGQVVSGMDVVDALSQWDTIERIRVWDGVNWIGQ
jgi:cyclophilin family peptidyl-prolyl cis-trans isomerase/HEAT repeat protein